MSDLRAVLLFFIFVNSNAVGAQIDTLKLLFAGDVMGHGPMIDAARQPDGSYNYDAFFKYVKPLVEQADLAVANLELTLPGNAPYSGYPRFRSPDAYAEALKNAGFDMIVTANNHSNDGGLEGVTHTIDVLRELDLQQTGTFKNRDERDIFYPLIVYIKNFKIVFLNYTYDTNGIPDHAPSLVNLIDTVQMRRDFSIARSLAPDFIIPIMHWGVEYQLKANADQKNIARKMIEWGADLIVGMHPHVVQPIENQQVMMPDGTQKSVVCAWSLGNFISNQRRENTEGGIIFHAVLTKKNDGLKANLADYSYSPVYRFMPIVGGKPKYFAVPTAREFSKPEMPANANLQMKKFEEITTKRIGNSVRKW